MGKSVSTRHAITMRELQKMSAATIKALPRAVPVKNGDETVGVLAPLKPYEADRWKAAFDRIDRNNAKLSPEVRRRVELLLGEIED